MVLTKLTCLSETHMQRLDISVYLNNVSRLPSEETISYAQINEIKDRKSWIFIWRGEKAKSDFQS